MTFGEVIHHVSHSKGWPEKVRGLASLLIPLHSADGLDFLECPASNSPESLDFPTAPATGLYTAADFKQLIHSTVTELKALAELPHYGGSRSTVPLWSQLLHALANTLSPDILILEDTPFVMPRVQDVATQPSDLIDGHATLIAAHAILSTSVVHLDRPSINSRTADEDELMYSAYSHSSGGSVHSLDSLHGIDLPLHAHMLPGQGKWHYAVLPVLLVADARNIVPLLCSTLYQRRVWGIREPVVGLCCSNMGTTATAIFGWLDFDPSEEGSMPVAHLALATGDRLDPLIGIFNFTDSSSAISLAQFVLRLRCHFEYIKGIASIEAVNSLTPFCWRSDLPDFKTQIESQLEDRVASWTYQVHEQTNSSETSSSSAPRTPSPLPDPVVFESSEKMSSRDLLIIDEDDVAHTQTRAPQSTRLTGRAKQVAQSSSSRDTSDSRIPSIPSFEPAIGTKENTRSRYSNSVFAGASDAGLVKSANISNWLFERNAFTVGRIEMPSDDKGSGINEMIKIYDQITAFTWSDDVQCILLDSEIDTAVSSVRGKLFATSLGGDHQSAIPMPKEHVEFISTRFSALLHAVQGACRCDGFAKLHGAHEAERRHEWDALLLTFFEPVTSQRDVLLERKLSFARNLAVPDVERFAERAKSITTYYEDLCYAQRRSLDDSGIDRGHLYDQAAAALKRALQSSDAIRRRTPGKEFLEEIKDHSRMEPDNGTTDAILVIACPKATTAILEGIQGDGLAENKFLKAFTLVHGKPDKPDVTPPPHPSLDRHNSQPNRTKLLPPSHVSVRQEQKEQKAMLQNPYLVHPDREEARDKPPEDKYLSEASGQDLLLPVLLTEYKKKDGSTVAKAMNQLRTYLVSSLQFLDALGITEQPIFGLVVNGRQGAVTMAWQKSEKIYIMERNVRHYDITDPLQAFQFVSVLLRLARHGLELRRRFEQKKDTAYYKSLTTSRWSKLAQIEDDKLRDGTEELKT